MPFASLPASSVKGMRKGWVPATIMFAATILQTGGLGSALGSPLVMMVIVMGIFYVMLILPQQRQRKKYKRCWVR